MKEECVCCRSLVTKSNKKAERGARDQHIILFNFFLFLFGCGKGAKVGFAAPKIPSCQPGTRSNLAHEGAGDGDRWA